MEEVGVQGKNERRNGMCGLISFATTWATTLEKTKGQRFWKRGEQPGRAPSAFAKMHAGGRGVLTLDLCVARRKSATRLSVLTRHEKEKNEPKKHRRIPCLLSHVGTGLLNLSIH